jgi:hypothetical protein
VGFGVGKKKFGLFEVLSTGLSPFAFEKKKNRTIDPVTV